MKMCITFIKTCAHINYARWYLVIGLKRAFPLIKTLPTFTTPDGNWSFDENVYLV